MPTVQREWLHRIGGWQWVEQPAPRRRTRPDEAGQPMGEAEPGADPDSLVEAEDGELAAEDENESEAAQVAGNPSGESAADAEGEAQNAPDADVSAPDELRLDVPEEVEQRREEEAQRRRRTGLNRGFAPQAFGLEGRYLRNLATRFARMVSKVAEDSADLPSEGDEEWDLNELIKRRFTGRLLSQCRMTREKRKVAVVLDTSPSCEHQARLFSSVARVAEELGDCELFDAPNFVITTRKLGDAWEALPDAERDWRFKGRVVLAFGDFDGMDRICQASQVRGNRIYWFCCEERPSVLESGRETFVKRYKGRYFPVTELTQLMHAMKRVR